MLHLLKLLNDFEDRRTFCVRCIEYDVDKDDNLVLEIKLPGYNKDNIKVVKSGKHSLKVSSVKENDKWSRVLNISQRYNVDKTDCLMKDGILTIKVPIKEEEKDKEIRIE